MKLTRNVEMILIFVSATFGATLKFVVKDCDPATGLPDCDQGYDDEYMVQILYCIIYGNKSSIRN